MRVLAVATFLVLATVLTSACSGKGSPEKDEMRAALNEWTAALNSGNYEAAYAKFSNLCRQNLPLSNFTENWKAVAGPGTGTLELTNLEIVSETAGVFQIKTAFELTRNGSTVSFGSESDPLVESMVKEDGAWRIYDRVCERLPPPQGETATPLP
jgi:hypothetical protein